MADPRDITTCTVCGATLIRHWTPSGMDYTWRDEAGSYRAGSGGPEGVDSIEDYLDWLRINDIGRYSLFLAQVTLGAGLLPWQHWHRPAPVTTASTARQTIPWCCGEPARRIRDGWVCREDHHHRLPTAAVTHPKTARRPRGQHHSGVRELQYNRRQRQIAAHPSGGACGPSQPPGEPDERT